MNKVGSPSETDNGVVSPRRVNLSPTGLVLLLFVAVVAGAFLGANRQSIYAAVAPVFGVKVAADTVNTDLLQKAYQKLQLNYDGRLDKSALALGAAKGLVAAAGDDYTVLFDAEEAEAFNDDMSGSIGGGIGAQVGLTDDVITLVKILPGTPAERSELKAGDRVLAINDESTRGYTVEDAVAKIRGEIGTTLKLSIVRGSKTEEVSVTREEINAPSVMSEVKNGVGVMTVVRFDSTTVQQAHKAAEEFKLTGVKGVVLDLRSNPGGLLDAAQGLAGLWLDRKVVVVEKTGDKVVDELKSGGAPTLGGVKTVVLINANSASASEIVAGALQDHKAATLMGETSFGKGSVQRLMPLADGTVLKVTIARWFTPNGKNISKDGIKPDQEVEMDPSKLGQKDDKQLNRALKILK